MQDALLDAVEDAVLDVVVASAELMPVLVIGAPCGTRTGSTTPRWSSTGVGYSASCPSRTCRRIASSTSAARWRRAIMVRGTIRMGGDDGRTCRSVRICCSPRPTCLVSFCTSRSARTCSCPCRRVPRPRWRVRRCWPTCPAARSRSAGPRTAACWPARRRRGAWPPMSMPRRARVNRPQTWPGTARPWCGRTGCALRSPNGSRRGSGARSPTWTSNCCGPSDCGWALSTTTASITASPTIHSGGWSLRSTRRRRHRPAPRGGALPLRAGGSHTAATGLL